MNLELVRPLVGVVEVLDVLRPGLGLEIRADPASAVVVLTHVDHVCRHFVGRVVLLTAGQALESVKLDDSRPVGFLQLKYPLLHGNAHSIQFVTLPGIFFTWKHP